MHRGKWLDFTLHEDGAAVHSVLSRHGTQSEAFLKDHSGCSLGEKPRGDGAVSRSAGRHCSDPGLAGAAVAVGAAERERVASHSELCVKAEPAGFPGGFDVRGKKKRSQEFSAGQREVPRLGESRR